MAEAAHSDRTPKVQPTALACDVDLDRHVHLARPSLVSTTSSPSERDRGHVAVFSAWKRTLDVLLCLGLLVFFGPLMIVIACLIKIFDPGPALYAQQRIGQHGRLFRCFKFRTMTIDAEKRLREMLATDPRARDEWIRLHKLTRDVRVTFIGRFLRLTSLDELPQLFNVLRGEMSLVGPRPIVAEERAKYRRYFHHYCSVKPGLTGLWQVSGRNNTTYRRRVALDVLYGRNWSIRLDLWILLRTVPAIIKADGVY